MRTRDLFTFMKERHDAYTAKVERAYPKPYTNDKILQKYRFCNVYRELDTQTQWFADNWREPHIGDSDLWFASLVFRVVNWHETAMLIGYPIPWKASNFVQALRRRKELNERVFNPAYIVSTNGVPQEKASYLAERLTEAWARRSDVRYRTNEPLREFHTRLMGLNGVGSFIAAQVVADMKYAGAAKSAPDWMTFAASGPGSRRGLARVMGSSPVRHWREEEWRATLRSLHMEIIPLVEKAKMPSLHAQDLQNCLCEFDKYERVRLKQGTPKQLYRGEAE